MTVNPRNLFLALFCVALIASPVLAGQSTVGKGPGGGVVVSQVPAATTTTINFDTPNLAGKPTDAVITQQFMSEGVELVDPGVQQLPHPIVMNDAGGYLYSDPSNAHSGKQVLSSYEMTDEGLEMLAGFLIHFSKFSSKVSLYAGAPPSPNLANHSGGPVQVTGYDQTGAIVATATVNVNAKANTPITIASPANNIAYVSVEVPNLGAPRLEIDDLSFVTPGNAKSTAVTQSPLAGPVIVNAGPVLSGLNSAKPVPLVVPKILSVSSGPANPFVTIVGDKPFTDATAVYFGTVAQTGLNISGKTIMVPPPPTGLLPGSNVAISVLLKNASSQQMLYSHKFVQIPVGEVLAMGPIPTNPYAIMDDPWIQGQGRSFSLLSPKNLTSDDPLPVFYVETDFNYTSFLESKPPFGLNSYAGNNATFVTVLEMCSVEPSTANLGGMPSVQAAWPAKSGSYSDGACKNWDGNSGTWQTVGKPSRKTMNAEGSQFLGVPTDSTVFNDQNYLRTLRVLVAVNLADTQESFVQRWDQKYTDAFNVAVSPSAFYQIKVQPQAILFAPPGDQSIASFTATSTYNTNYTVGNSTTQSNKTSTENSNSWAASLGLTAGGDVGVGKASANFSEGMGGGMDATTTNGYGVQNGTTYGGSSALSLGYTVGLAATPTTTPGNGMTCASATDCSSQTEVANWWAGEPFWNDTFLLSIHPQYAFYVLGNNTDRSVMYASVKGSNQVQVLQLWACATGVKLYGLDQCTLSYTDSAPVSSNGQTPVNNGTSKTLELTPREAKNLLALDPFYIDGQGASPKVTRASLIGPYNYGVKIGVTRANPVTLPFSNTQVKQSGTSGQTTYTASAVNATSTTETTGGGFSFGFILSWAFSGSDTETTKYTTETDAQTVYQDSTAVSDQQVTSASVTLNDIDNQTLGNSGPSCKTCHNPLPYAPTVNVYLDRIYGGFMFQDPAAGPAPSAAQRAAWEAAFDVPAMTMAQEKAQHRFHDVDDSSPQKVAIGVLARLGVMAGYADGTFKPDQPVTRGELAVALSRSLTLGVPKTVMAFADVPANSGIARAASAALSAGLLTQPNAGKFNPDDAVSPDEFKAAVAKGFSKASPASTSGGSAQTRGDAAAALFAALQSQK